MRERANPRLWPYGSVKQHDVEKVQGQVRQQTGGPALAADQAHAQRQGRFQELGRHQLGHDVGNADCQSLHAIARAPLNRLLELACEREDLLGDSAGIAPLLAEDEMAPGTAKQPRPEALLEVRDL